MMGTGNGGLLKLLVRPSYHAALLERLKMDRSALTGHHFRERVEGLLAEVARAYVGSANHPAAAQRGGDREELKEQYAPLFWHYLSRALRAADEVEFALMEARVRCLLQEFRAETGRPIGWAMSWDTILWRTGSVPTASHELS